MVLMEGIMERLKAFFESNPQAKILDVGTGRGNFIDLIDYLYKDYEKIVGIDIMEKMVELAANHFEGNEKIKIVQRDILKTGFPKEHFDIVCLSNSLHHLEEMKATFQAMEELVKPGGYLLFNEMMKDNLNARQISHRLIHHFSAKLDTEVGMLHNETYNRQEIVDNIKDNTSFEVVDFWDMIVPVTEPTQEETTQMVRTVDALLMRLRDDKLIAKHKDEAEAIKKYIGEHGVEACTQLVVIAKRKN